LVHSAADNTQGKPSDYFGQIDVEMISPFEAGIEGVPTFMTTLYQV